MNGGRPAILGIGRLAIVTGDIRAATSFFADAFAATPVARGIAEPGRAALLGLPGARIATALLRIGAQALELLQIDPPGRPYPAGSGSSDLWFQHFAVIVSDMAAAYARLCKAGRFMPISSDGPVELPPASGSVTAFKFRDAEGHPLELLAFSPGKAPDAWRSTRSLVLGIDHSAISVGDVAASIAFFEEAFGLRVTARSENHGIAQVRLDNVPDARVSVVGLAPQRAPPHVELLGYHGGPRRPIDGATRSNDIAATHLVLETRALDPIVEALTALQASFVSPGIVALADGSRAIMVLDPDGHRFAVVEGRRS